MNREEQLAAIKRDAHLAIHRVQAMLGNNEAQIIALVYARVADGYETYGSAGWSKSPHELDSETLEELADAIAYQVMRRAQLP